MKYNNVIVRKDKLYLFCSGEKKYIYIMFSTEFWVHGLENFHNLFCIGLEEHHLMIIVIIVCVRLCMFVCAHWSTIHERTRIPVSNCLLVSKNSRQLSMIIWFCHDTKTRSRLFYCCLSLFVCEQLYFEQIFNNVNV